jgi:hypothetical protein
VVFPVSSFQIQVSRIRDDFKFDQKAIQRFWLATHWPPWESESTELILPAESETLKPQLPTAFSRKEERKRLKHAEHRSFLLFSPW